MNRSPIFWAKMIVISTLLTVLGGCMSMMAMHEQMHGGHGSSETGGEKDKTESQGGHSH